MSTPQRISSYRRADHGRDEDRCGHEFACDAGKSGVSPFRLILSVAAARPAAVVAVAPGTHSPGRREPFTCRQSASSRVWWKGQVAPPVNLTPARSTRIKRAGDLFQFRLADPVTSADVSSLKLPLPVMPGADFFGLLPMKHACQRAPSVIPRSRPASRAVSTFEPAIAIRGPTSCPSYETGEAQ